MTKVRVVLVDDHPVVLAGIKSLLMTAPEVTVVGEGATGHAALRLILDTSPDVAVIDISLPDISGIELAGRLAEACPDVSLLALSVHEDRAYVQQLLQAGARGYLLKRSAAEELVRAIRAIAAGGMYLDPAVVSKAMSDVHAGGSAMGEHDSLSPREQDVLRLIAQGFANKEIAARLQISTKTVETYKARAAEKLSLRTRADIVKYGAAQGWLETL
ncbi:response regulator transcription factor [Acidisoma sp. L85]|uniref:response regulator transcription factor n=1 Tax=Acidisoma sp. L85 TaxID=1641850 RepID=UPI00131CD7ED|nr:response regulator transcription factor [Acidisoma sp. L85]